MGQLGNNTTTASDVPVPVNTAAGVSALNGKTVVSIAASEDHTLALCSDGTVAAWGSNGVGQLGDDTSTQRNAPVAVNTASGTSALYGKSVVAIAAGAYVSFALCSDGTLVGWGEGSGLGLGDPTYANHSTPVAITGSALAAKTIFALAAGRYHTLALCSDGTLIAWGSNGYGELGSGTGSGGDLPVAVNTDPGTSALYGKTVTSMAAGDEFSLALCSDGTVAAWGHNHEGQLGDNSTTDRHVPVAVNTVSGVSVLFGKTVIAIGAGWLHGLALCSDGTAAAWGLNTSGELGNGTYTQKSLVPVAVGTTSLPVGASFTWIYGGGSDAERSLATVAGPQPSVATLAATSITPTGATLNGTVNANNNSTAVSFDYGTDLSYGTNVGGTPTPVTGSGATAVSAALTALNPNTTYHFRVNGISVDGTANGIDLSFTTLDTIANWRQTWYGTTSNTGNAADTAAPYNTGIQNLDAFAFGGPNQNPAHATANFLPRAQISGGYLLFNFNQPAGVSGITYGAEWSSTLQANDWHAINDTGSGGAHFFGVPIGSNTKLFIRLKVTEP